MLVEMSIEKIRQYFCFDQEYYLIYLKNKEIYQYIPNLLKWKEKIKNEDYNIYEMVTYAFEFDYIITNEDNVKNIPKLFFNSSLFFEFETEEEAFYFKLKYC